MRSLFACLFIFSFFTNVSAEQGEGFFRLDKNPTLEVMDNFKASELCSVAEGTHRYLTKFPEDKFAVHAGKVFKHEITLSKVKKTLAFICNTYREDVREKRNSRMHDVDFLKANFDFYRWSPDIKTAQALARKSSNETKTSMLNAIPENKIFLTKYYTKLLTASNVKTSTHNQALYALPYDEVGLSQQEADKNLALTRHKYTRQQVIEGVLETKKLAEPLVWLSEEALHDVLLQGTGVLEVDGKRRYFNVHRNNGIAYDYTIGKREQARYWYFAEVPGVMGYGEIIDNKIALSPHVSFAGNVAQLGLGKLFMVAFQQNEKLVARMGVLADQGGAFDNNLFQLDLLVDSYYGWSDYHLANKHMPDYAKAWLMILKER